MNLEESVITWYIKLVIKVRFSLFSIYIELLYIMLCLASTSVGAKCQHESILVHLNVSIFLNYVVHPETMHNFQIVVFDIFFFFFFVSKWTEENMFPSVLGKTKLELRLLL